MLNILLNDYTDGVVPVDLPLESVQLLRQDEDQNRGQLKGKNKLQHLSSTQIDKC